MLSPLAETCGIGASWLIHLVIGGLSAAVLGLAGFVMYQSRRYSRLVDRTLDNDEQSAGAIRSVAEALAAIRTIVEHLYELAIKNRR